MDTVNSINPQQQLTSIAVSVASIIATIVLVFSVMFSLNRNRDSDGLTWFGSFLLSFFFAPIYLPYALVDCGGEASEKGAPSIIYSSCFARRHSQEG